MNTIVTYCLIGRGWCECKLDIDGQSVTVTGAYMSDPLYEFCTAVQALLNGAPSVRFSFDEEPGEYRFALDAIDDERATLKVFEFKQLRINAPDSDGAVIFNVSVVKLALARALRSTMARLLEEHGEAGYLEQWVYHPFPSERYEQLGVAIRRRGSDSANHQAA